MHSVTQTTLSLQASLRCTFAGLSFHESSFPSSSLPTPDQPVVDMDMCFASNGVVEGHLHGVYGADTQDGASNPLLVMASFEGVEDGA